MSMIATTGVIIHAWIRIAPSLHRSYVILAITHWFRAWLKMGLVENSLTFNGLVRFRRWNTFESPLEFIVVEAVFGGHRDLFNCECCLVDAVVAEYIPAVCVINSTLSAKQLAY